MRETSYDCNPHVTGARRERHHAFALPLLACTTTTKQGTHRDVTRPAPLACRFGTGPAALRRQCWRPHQGHCAERRHPRRRPDITRAGNGEERQPACLAALRYRRAGSTRRHAPCRETALLLAGTRHHRRRRSRGRGGWHGGWLGHATLDWHSATPSRCSTRRRPPVAARCGSRSNTTRPSAGTKSTSRASSTTSWRVTRQARSACASKRRTSRLATFSTTPIRASSTTTSRRACASTSMVTGRPAMPSPSFTPTKSDHVSPPTTTISSMPTAHCRHSRKRVARPMSPPR